MCVCHCTDRQVDEQVGAIEQSDATAQTLFIGRRRRHAGRQSSVTVSRCPAAATTSSARPPSADESYQSRHRLASTDAAAPDNLNRTEPMHCVSIDSCCS